MVEYRFVVHPPCPHWPDRDVHHRTTRPRAVFRLALANLTEYATRAVEDTNVFKRHKVSLCVQVSTLDFVDARTGATIAQIPTPMLVVYRDANAAANP